MSLLCQVYRSPRRAEMYLFVEKSRGLADVPESLMTTFGAAEPFMVLALTPGKKLARADAREVIESINAQGYYLQMPPTPAELLARERADDG